MIPTQWYFVWWLDGFGYHAGLIGATHNKDTAFEFMAASLEGSNYGVDIEIRTLYNDSYYLFN